MSVTQRIFAAICEYTKPTTTDDSIESLRGTLDELNRENVTKDFEKEIPLLKGFRPDLDLEAQKARYAFDKKRAHLTYLSTIARDAEMKSNDFSRVAVQGLLDEAYRLYASQHTGEDYEIWWEVLAKDTMSDFDASGPQSVMANLSCMSLFIPGHEADFYGPNAESRTMRMARKKKLLQRVKVSSSA